MSQVTVISGVERRRTWSYEQKLALVEATMMPGANVADIARRADVRPSQIYRWRRDLLDPTPATGFAPVVVSPDQHEVSERPLAMVIELGGAIVRIAADAPAALVTATLRSLKR